MKHQQVVVDYWSMLKTSFTCLLLAVSGYVLIKMVQTIFWLPSHLKNNQRRLEEMAHKYEDILQKEQLTEKDKALLRDLGASVGEPCLAEIGEPAKEEVKKDI